jgi:protein TonB
MIRDSAHPVPDVGPLMQIDYVTVQTQPVKEQRKPIQVQQKKTLQEVQQEKIPEPPAPVPEITDVPVESADIPHQEAGSPSVQEQTTVSAQKPELQQIGNVAELDNTDFEPLVNPKPDYPPVAQASQITGYVDVELVISEQGKVESFTIVETRGHPAFAVETAKVLPRWRFPPPRIGGKKVRVQYMYRIKFTLN